MADLKKHVKKRKGHRLFVTETLKRTATLLTTDSTERNVDLALQLKASLVDQLNRLEGLDEKILDLLTEAVADKEDGDREIFSEVHESGSMRSEMTAALVGIEKYLEVNTAQAVVVENSQSTTRSKVQAKLPKLEMPTFTGRPEQWQEFWDTFQSAVHDNGDISDVDKFAYLRRYVSGAAKSSITGFRTTAANYGLAIEALQKRFGKKSIIHQAHVDALLNLQPVYNDWDTARLRKLYDAVECNHRALEALDVNPLTYESIVVPGIIKKLPEGIRLQITRGKDYMNWTVDELLEQIRNELELREEYGRMEKKNVRLDHGKRDGVDAARPTTASTLVTKSKNLFCAFCKGNHEHHDCKEITSVDQRKQLARKYGRCYLCMRKGHVSWKCNSNFCCARCKGKHHISLCDSPGESAGPTGISTSPTLHVGTECGVALQTAQALVKCSGLDSAVRVRVLFDTGSQRSFVTPRVVSGSQPIRKETVEISTFGQEGTIKGLKEVFAFELCPVNGGEGTKIEAYLVPSISSVRNEHIEVRKLQYAHLKGLWFSDVCKNADSLEVEVLIGSDYLWCFQGDRTIRGEQQDPVAVETKLGWVLSGPLRGERGRSEMNVNLVGSDVIKDENHGKKEEERELEKSAKKLWDLETVGIREENEVHEALKDNISFNGERYKVGLPWKEGHDKLPSNYWNSLKRLKGQVNKLRQEPEILKECDRIIKEQLDRGIIERAWEPTKPENLETVETHEEEKKSVVLIASEKVNASVGNVMNVEAFSSIQHLYRVTAWVKRFVSNLKAKQRGILVTKGELTRDEIVNAERLWILEVQGKLKEQNNYKVLPKDLQIVEYNKLLKCKGRLGNSDLCFDARQPIIIPRQHHLTKLIVEDCHRRVHHSGLRSTLAEVRSKFWVPRGRQTVKSILRDCIVCKRVQGKAFETPPVADLPDFRVNEAPAFANVGVDFAGPLYVKERKGVMKKVYIVIFACCVTRAVHLELVPDMTVQVFLNCLRRFAARRGTPSLIVSDNAKTFKAAKILLKNLYKDQGFRGYIAQQGITWRFNLSKAPWWGSSYERMIGTMKRCLRKVLSNARMTFEELQTILVEVEGTLNSRPLTYEYDEVGSEVLTPAHLICGRRLLSIPDHAVEDDVTDSKLMKRFRYLARKKEHF